MTKPDDPRGRAPDEERERLQFLRDEGFEVLALYRSIRDEKRRYLLKELMRVIADDQSKVDGDGHF